MPDMQAITIADPSLNATVAAIADIQAALEATAGAAGPVGHGTVRLRGRPAPPEAHRSSVDGAADVGTDLAAAAGPIGHGAIVLRGDSSPERQAAGAADAQLGPVDATEAARRDVLAALATAT